MTSLAICQCCRAELVLAARATLRVLADPSSSAISLRVAADELAEAARLLALASAAPLSETEA
jgi:hypothetical protein